MKIIITESQLNTLKENSIVDMDKEELLDRALKLKKFVIKNVKEEFINYDWFDDLVVEIYKDWNNMPVIYFLIKTNIKILKNENVFKKIRSEIYEKIEFVFIQYFPNVNKNTTYNLTATFEAIIKDSDNISFHV